MTKKLAIYSLLALLTGGTISFSFNDGAVAHDIKPVADRPTTPAPMSMSMEVDKAFIKMMIPHHQSANEMTKVD